MATTTAIFLINLLGFVLITDHKLALANEDKDEAETILVATKLGAPFVMLREEPDEGGPLEDNDRYQGFFVDLMREMANNVGFHFQLVLTQEESSWDHDGKWHGIIGNLTRKEVQMGGPLVISAMLERVVDFSTPFLRSGISLITKKPVANVNLSKHLFLVLTPFTWGAWILIVVATIGTGIVLYLIHRCLASKLAVPDEHEPSVLDALWWSFRTFLLQGSSEPTSPLPIRILSCAWFGFTLMVLFLYFGFLSNQIPNGAHLTETPEPAVESVQDLTKQSEIKYGVLNGSSTQTFFRVSKVPVYEKIWDTIAHESSDALVASVEDGLKKVRDADGRYVFMLDSTYAKYHINRKPCDLMQIGPQLNSVGLGIAMPINSPMLAQLRLAVLLMSETGMLQKLHDKWLMPQCKDESSVEKGVRTGNVVLPPGDVHVITGPLIMLMVGTIVAVLVGIIQMVCHKKQAKRNKESSTA